jgi:hypothetical protein
MSSSARAPTQSVPVLFCGTMDSGLRVVSSLLAMALACGIGMPAAHADEDEASFHSQLQVGQATIGEPELDGATNELFTLGVGARATYATSNWYAYEAHLTWTQPTRSAYYERGDGLFIARQNGWLRLDAGLTARLGVEYVPTVHAAVGAQTRFGGRARTSFESWTYETDGYAAFDLVGSLGLGFDWRPPGEGDHWVFGAMGMVQRVLWSTGPSLETRSLMFHIGYYFYWFPGAE